MEDAIAARGGPVWYQLYASPKWEVAEALVKRAERAGSPVVVVTVDRVAGRNQETFFRLRKNDPRECKGCHSEDLQESVKRKPRLRRYRSERPAQPAVGEHELGLHQAPARRDQDEDRREGHPHRRGRRSCAWRTASTASSSQPRRRGEDSGRATIDVLPEVVDAVQGQDTRPYRRRVPARHRRRQGARHGRERGGRRPAVPVGARRVRRARRGEGAEILRTETRVAMMQCGSALGEGIHAGVRAEGLKTSEGTRRSLRRRIPSSLEEGCREGGGEFCKGFPDLVLPGTRRRMSLKLIVRGKMISSSRRNFLSGAAALAATAALAPLRASGPGKAEDPASSARHGRRPADRRAGALEVGEPDRRERRALRGGLRRRCRASAGARGGRAQHAALRLHHAPPLRPQSRLRQLDLRRLGSGPARAGGRLRPAADQGDDRGLLSSSTASTSRRESATRVGPTRASSSPRTNSRSPASSCRTRTSR